MKNYKETLLMMQTEFPMRGDLGKKEPGIQEKWEQMHLYEKAWPTWILPLAYGGPSCK